MRKPDNLIRFMLRHAANGMALGAVFVLVLIWTDTAGLGRLLAMDSSGLATAVLFFQTSLTFGAASMGLAVMSLGEKNDDSDE